MKQVSPVQKEGSSSKTSKLAFALALGRQEEDKCESWFLESNQRASNV